jgi:RNA polymerase sigma-70 factor, ECF subfamily
VSVAAKQPEHCSTSDASQTLSTEVTICLQNGHLSGRAATQEDGLSDRVLMRRILDGNEIALAAVYDRYAGLVYSVLRRMMGDPGSAEEIMQDVFYGLWRRPSRFDPARGELAALLAVTARNRAIDRLRVRGAVAGLLQPQREALELAYFDGLTHREIAQKTGNPLGTVKTRIRTALKALREALNCIQHNGKELTSAVNPGTLEKLVSPTRRNRTP